MWYVATMDEILAECDTLQEAKRACTTMDARKSPTFKKISEEFYEYIPSREQQYEGGYTRYIGTKAGMIAHEFGEHLEEWRSLQAESVS